MYVLYKGTGNDRVEIGWFDNFPDAQCALEAELKKKDGQTITIESEGEE